MSQKASFKKLQTEWYKKLADTGFEDAEDKNDMLKTWSTRFNNKHDASTWHAKAEYYRMTRHFLIDYKFDSAKDRIIWEYHSEGMSYRNIAKILCAVNIITDRSSVYRLIKRLRNSMYALYVLPQGEYHE